MRRGGVDAEVAQSVLIVADAEGADRIAEQRRGAPGFAADFGRDQFGSIGGDKQPGGFGAFGPRNHRQALPEDAAVIVFTAAEKQVDARAELHRVVDRSERGVKVAQDFPAGEFGWIVGRGFGVELAVDQHITRPGRPGLALILPPGAEGVHEFGDEVAGDFRGAADGAPVDFHRGAKLLLMPAREGLGKFISDGFVVCGDDDEGRVAGVPALDLGGFAENKRQRNHQGGDQQDGQVAVHDGRSGQCFSRTTLFLRNQIFAIWVSPSSATIFGFMSNTLNFTSATWPEEFFMMFTSCWAISPR